MDRVTQPRAHEEEGQKKGLHAHLRRARVRAASRPPLPTRTAFPPGLRGSRRVRHPWRITLTSRPFLFAAISKAQSLLMPPPKSVGGFDPPGPRSY
ncbi:hypothetical protein [Thermus brockianus]